MFDYIVVGAGSAGCVLAHRLSEDPDVQVLLLEAGGPDSKPEIHVPAAWPALLFTEVDWAYFSDDEPGLDGRRLFLPRGKVLGGSSAINALVYMRGNRRDFDEWRDLGNPGWGFDDVLPYFLRSEDNERGASAYHGAGGPLAVSDQPHPHPVSAAFVEAGVELGLDRTDDFNGERQEGIGLTQVTARDGRRHSTATAFLSDSAGRANLTVRTGVQVRRVLVEDGAAVGVEFLADGQVGTERVDREVVVAAGAVDSPKLLMLSGIGEADRLRQLGIDVVLDLPGVGRNLSDHPCVSVGYVSTDATPPAPDSNLVEAALFTHTSGEQTGRPDLEMPFGPILYVGERFRREGPGFTFVPLLTRPSTTGSVTLRSADPTAPAAISLNFLSDERDVARLIEGIRLARRLAATEAMAGVRGEEVAPGPQAQTDDDLRAYLREAGESLFHMAGTCRMGTDEGAVVDPELRVHGVRGLRVVDASVMPTITNGNTNAPVIMIAEKAADLIRDTSTPVAGARASEATST